MDEISDGQGRGRLRRSSTTPTAPACTMCGRPSHMFDNGVQFRCRNCDDEWTIHITGHAWDRWYDRSETPDEHPIEVYKRGIRFLDEGTRVKGDEFRYDHDSRCLFIRKKHKVVTIEHVPSCRTPIQRAAVRSLIRLDREATTEITQLCNDCDITVDELKGIVQFERGITNADALVSDEERDDLTLQSSDPAFADTDTEDSDVET